MHGVGQPLHHAGRQRRGRIVLEVAVGDLAEPIVWRIERLFHRVKRPGIAEPREQDERFEANVTIGMLADRLEQCRHGNRARGAPDGAAGFHPRRIIEVAQLRDGGLELRLRNRRGTTLLR